MLIIVVNFFCSASSGSQLHSEVASYVEEELKLVQDELLSSEEVLSKVKLEMQKAMSSGDPFRTEAIIVITIK